MRPKEQLLTDDEYKQIILMAVSAKPQTEEQLEAVIKAAESIRTESLMLELVLEGSVCMYQDGGEIMFCPNGKD